VATYLAFSNSIRRSRIKNKLPPLCIKGTTSMSSIAKSSVRAITGRSLIVLLIAAFAELALGQQPSTPSKEDVVRVATTLVQTQVSVTDKKGQFVDGLRREQFELRVAGKVLPFNFFERVTAGSPREKELATHPNLPVAVDKPGEATTVQGRTIMFFIDDLHLSPESLNRSQRSAVY
jgi:hypothetical protein